MPVNINGTMYVSYISDIYFLNENTGYIVVKELGGEYRFKKTTDGGLNWQNMTAYPSISFFDKIYFTSSETGWAASGSGAVSKTTNGGVNWISGSFAGSTQQLKKVKFINQLTGWILTQRSVYKTTTGGVTFTNHNSSFVPDNYSLSQNYPNPFNPSTKINYELPITNYVSIKVYDVLGNEIETLVNEKQNAGSYSVDFNAASLPSGIYFYKLVTDRFSETKKMILMK